MGYVVPEGMTTKTRHIGFCPICEGDFKLADESRLVHHGYKRPGWGCIVGDCLSVHKAPYELSDAVCHEYKAALLDKLDINEKHLAKLERGEVSSFLVERRKPNGGYRETEWVVVATPNGYDFIRELESKINDTKWQIKGIKKEIARMDKWIDGWATRKNTAVRTFEEEMEKKAALAAERKAIKDARNAKKQAKADALKAKYAMWEQEKAALMAKHKAVFLALSEEMEEAEGRDSKVAEKIRYRALEAALKMKKERNKKGYLSFYARELEIDQHFVVLGLAEVHDDGWVQHRY